MKLSASERRIAMMHATAHEEAFASLHDQLGRRHDIDPKVMYSLSVMVLTLGGEYRRIANSGRINE
jgi:hypothetical protein